MPTRKPPALLESAPLAYENEGFLNGPDGRILRIMAEYYEPMARFRRERIQDTVVFFGSARFRALDVANAELELLENTGSQQPAPAEEQPARQPEQETSELRRSRAKAAVEMARYYEDARRLACLLTTGPKISSSAAIASSSPPAEAPASWRPPTAAPTRPAGKPSA